jgi:hypothetical protein
MPNALSEYRAPLKLPSSSTLDTRKDASPKGTRSTFPASTNGVVRVNAPSVPRCGSGGGVRLLTGGAEFNLDVEVNREEKVRL